MGETTGSKGGNENDDRAEMAPGSCGVPDADADALDGRDVGGLGPPLISDRFVAWRREKRDPSLLGDVPVLGGAPLLRDGGRLAES